MIKKIINPFEFIAGYSSLLLGLLILLLTSVIGFLSGIHFPDIISVKTSPDFPIGYFIFQGYANWLVISLLLYMVAVLFSKSSVRIVDIFGTQALARFPYLISAFMGFSDSIDKFGKHVLWENLQMGEPVNLSVWDTTIAILLLALTVCLTIWLVILMLNAFKVSANLKGSKANVLFFSAFILSVIITIFITNYLTLQFS